MKTSEEIKALKDSWLSDPSWDIEHTEGFEDYRDDLLAFRLHIEREEKEDHQAKIQGIADDLECSYALAEYLDTEHWKLKQEISRLEGRILYLEKKLGLKE